jgi:TRAP-type C4-dicarboxylate transport system substrate-binding protein
MTYSLALWNQLTPEEQGVLQDGADFAIEVSRALAPGREVAALDLLREQGMTVTEIDTTSFAEASLPLQEQLAEEIGAREILDQIRAAAE